MRGRIAGLPFCSPSREVRWDHCLFLKAEEENVIKGRDRLADIMRVIAERRAQRFPHAGARAFTEHIVGVANLLAAWNQPEDICLVDSNAALDSPAISKMSTHFIR